LFHFSPLRTLGFALGGFVIVMSIADRFDLLGAASSVNHEFDCLREF